jgi:hypothetical protein
MAWGVKFNLFKKSIFCGYIAQLYMKLILNFRLLINFDHPIPLCAPVIMLIGTALLLDSNIRNSVCTPPKLPCRRVEVGYENNNNVDIC